MNIWSDRPSTSPSLSLTTYLHHTLPKYIHTHTHTHTHTQPLISTTTLPPPCHQAWIFNPSHRVESPAVPESSGWWKRELLPVLERIRTRSLGKVRCRGGMTRFYIWSTGLPDNPAACASLTTDWTDESRARSAKIRRNWGAHCRITSLPNRTLEASPPLSAH